MIPACRVAGVAALTLAMLRDALSSPRVIKSFHCEHTQELFEGGSAPSFRAFQRVAERKLTQLHAARTLDFLRSPPGNRLESLRGGREGTYSIRINDQWRVCVRWNGGDAFDVAIVDYH